MTILEAKDDCFDLLPPRLLTLIICELSVPDLCSLAQVSKSCNKAVKKDETWISRLRSMGLWDPTKGPEPALTQGPQSPLNIIQSVRPDVVPNKANIIFMTIFRHLYPLFSDIESKTPRLFQIYDNSVDQACVLSQLRIFAKCVSSDSSRIQSLILITRNFEAKTSTQFEEACVSGRSDQALYCSQALIALDRSSDCFKIVTDTSQLALGSGYDFLNESGELNAAKLQAALQNITDLINLRIKVIESNFPSRAQGISTLCQNVVEKQISEAFTSVIVTSKSKDVNYYLSAMPSLYFLILWFVDHVNPPAAQLFHDNLKRLFIDIFDLHIEAYLEDELANFVCYATEQVSQWIKEVEEADTATETFLMGNVTKVQDKNDILASFKKALLIPVSILPPAQFSIIASAVSEIPSVGLPNIFRRTAPATIEPSKSAEFENAFFSKKTRNLTLPTSELDAHFALMENKLLGIKTLFSLELALNIIQKAREAIERASKFVSASKRLELITKAKIELIFVELVRTLGGIHVQNGFDKALNTLDKYVTSEIEKPKSGRSKENESSVEPLAIFIELVNIGDLIQQMIHLFFERELALPGYIDVGNSLAPAINAKRNFEKMLDEKVARGLNRGIDVLSSQIEAIFRTNQKASNYNVIDPATDFTTPTLAAKTAVKHLRLYMGLLAGTTDDSVVDVFQLEVSARFFSLLCRHIKHQTVTTIGAAKLLQDLNFYYDYVSSLKQRSVLPYFQALKEIGLMYLINGQQTMELAQMLTDLTKYGNIFQVDELLEFAQRREDWLRIRKPVQKAMKGLGTDCVIM